MIEGYPGRDSVVAGQILRLHVRTDRPRVRVELWRQGATLERFGESRWLTGCDAPVPPHPDGVAGRADPAVDWSWPAYELPTGPDWPSGLYVAELHGEGAQDAWREGFVVRPRVPGSPILYKVATFTGHAYAAAGGASLYEHPVYVPRAAAGQAFGHKVSMRRPGAMAHFEQWDVPMLGWLQRSGYRVDLCTDLDLHEDPALLDDYRLLLSPGHDEYWSAPMRAGVEAFVQRGGNVAFLGANTCWWRVHVTDGATALVSDTDHPIDGADGALGATDRWWAPPPGGLGRPENALTGTSFRNAGMWPGWFTDPGRPRLGFTVQRTGHWVFEGTGLRDGDVLGDGLALVGYECDGATFGRDDDGVAHADGRDGTPPSFSILGIAVLDPVREPPPEDFYKPCSGAWVCAVREPGASSPRAATMGVLTTSGGTVFCAATTSWPMILGADADPNVARITRNVLERGVRVSPAGDLEDRA